MNKSSTLNFNKASSNNHKSANQVLKVRKETIDFIL